ncbi:MAG: hypothetical protein JWR69_948 [Pedosphaera sp.]|nr:hypothetical protein [Pedosphaera sp.]
MKKSGRKRVYDQGDEGLGGRLNEAAREVFGGDHPEITPGTAGLTDPLRQQQTSRAQEILQTRRRRKLASLQKWPRSKRVHIEKRAASQTRGQSRG